MFSSGFGCEGDCEDLLLKTNIFPQYFHFQVKATLLGAVFLLDYMYFEKRAQARRERFMGRRRGSSSRSSISSSDPSPRYGRDYGPSDHSYDPGPKYGRDYGPRDGY